MTEVADPRNATEKPTEAGQDFAGGEQRRQTGEGTPVEYLISHWASVEGNRPSTGRAPEAVASTPRSNEKSLGGGIAARKPPTDLVECSVFAPPRPRRASRILIQALLHTFEQRAAAIYKAQEIVPDANRKGIAKLETRIARGAEVSLYLDLPSLEVERPLVRLNWSGEPQRAVYSVVVPEHAPLGPCQGRVLVMVRDVQVGEIEFALQIAERRRAEPAPGTPGLATAPGFVSGGLADPDGLDDATRSDKALVATASHNFSRAFISYSRKDFDEVSRHAETLEECGVEVLIDVTSIPRGAEWEREIPRLVNAADVVYVMWSDNAAKSPWVDKEARHAVDLYDARVERRPRIVPMLVHTPAPALHGYLQRFNVKRDWSDRREAHQSGPLFKPSGDGGA